METFSPLFILAGIGIASFALAYVFRHSLSELSITREGMTARMDHNCALPFEVMARDMPFTTMFRMKPIRFGQRNTTLKS